MKYIVTRENNSDTLMHYGIPGMRWRNRRAFVRNSGNVRMAKKNFINATGKFNDRSEAEFDKWLSANKEFKNAKKSIKNPNSLEYEKAKNKFDNANNRFTNKMNSGYEEYLQKKAKYKAAKKEAAKEFDNRLSEYKDAKNEYKGIKKQFNKDFRSAERYQGRHLLAKTVFKDSKAGKEINRRWDNVENSSNQFETARNKYKKAKRRLKNY